MSMTMTRPDLSTTPLSAAELDSTTGGASPFFIVAGIFLFGAAAGMVDRILFGGCKCH